MSATSLIPQPRCRLAHSRFFRASLLAAVVVWLLAADAMAAGPWATGTELRRKLKAAQSASWSGSPLRSVLTRLAETSQVAYLLDRRVDPSQKVDFAARNTPVEQLMRQLARRHRLAMTMVGPVAYYGPPKKTTRLRTLAALQNDAVKKLPPEVYQKFFNKSSMKWDDFATPRDLLQEIASQERVQIVGLQTVPHDLWAAADLPPMTFIDRMTILLNQFDLSFQISADGNQMKLIPIPADLGIVKSFGPYPEGQDPAPIAQQYAQMAPNAKIRIIEQTIWIKGSLEDHEQIAKGVIPVAEPAPIAGDPVAGTDPAAPGDGTDPAADPSAPDNGGHTGFPIGPVEPEPPKVNPNLKNQRFDATVAHKPLGDVLYRFTQQLGLQMKQDDEAIKKANVDMMQLISFKTDKADANGLFAAMLKDTKLGFKLDMETGVLDIFVK